MEKEIIGKEKMEKLISFRVNLINLICESKDNKECVINSKYFSDEEKKNIIEEREKWISKTEKIIKIITEQLKREFNYSN